MLGRSAGIVAASALGASGFLIPANIVPFGNDDAAIAPAVLTSKQAIVQLPCSECAFTKKQLAKSEDVADSEAIDDQLWAMGSANSIVVNLSISEDGQKLQVNGQPVYPLNYEIESMLAHRVYVDQVASSASIEDIEKGKAGALALEVTGSGVSVQGDEVNSPNGDTIIPITHSIFELETQPVSLDDIKIKLLKTVGGELFIAQVSTEAKHASLPQPEFFAPPKWVTEMDLEPSQDASGHKECENLPATFCKLKNMVEDRLAAMRQGRTRKGRKGGCHGRKGKGPVAFHNRISAHFESDFLRAGHDGDEMRRHHGMPHHMRPHGHQHHHNHHFMHSFGHGLIAVLIPTMTGIAVGMLVSIVGVVLGRLISFLWIKFYRGGRRGYESVRLQEEDVDDADTEKKSLVILETSEPLPVYEEAPSYEQFQAEQK